MYGLQGKRKAQYTRHVLHLNVIDESGREV